MFSEAFKIEFNQELVGMNYLRVVPLADRLATVFAMQRPTVDWVSVRDALIKWVERLDREKAEGQSATSQTPAPAEAAGNVQPAKVKAQAPATRKLMPDRFRRAWESYRFAADRVPDAKDQKALHEYLKEHGCEQYGGEGKPSLPDFRTWQRYYRDGRDWHKRIFSEIRDSQKR
jgi:hypothetical protein